jgi:hypothetical protein
LAVCAFSLSRFNRKYHQNSASARRGAVQSTRRTGSIHTPKKENHMQFGSSDNLHHHRKGISCRPPDVARSFSRWAGKLFNHPLTYIALVWGLMFLALGVTLAYAQDAAPIARRQHAQR